MAQALRDVWVCRFAQAARCGSNTLEPWGPTTLVGVARPEGVARAHPLDGYQGDTMLRDWTRSNLVQMWFVAIVLVGAAVVAFGPAVTLGTAAMLFAVSLVPPAILFALWPETQSATASDVLHGTDRRA